MKFVIVQAWLHKEVDKWQAADGNLFSFNVFVPVSLDLTSLWNVSFECWFANENVTCKFSAQVYRHGFHGN